MTVPLPMPTVAGDIVITHVDASRSMHAVWTVAVDGERAAHPPPGAACALGADAAVSLARTMRRDSGGAAIFLFDPHTLNWTKLSD